MSGERGVRSLGCAGLLPFSLGAGGDERSSLGLEEHDLGVGPRRLEDAADTLEGASGAVAGDEVVEPLAREIREDLGTGGAGVERGVGVVLELPAEEPSVLLAELFRLGDHTGALASLGRDDHLGAEHPHDLTALHGEGLRHADYTVVTPLRANHGHRDAGIAGGGLDDSVAGLEQTLLLGVGDDGEREAVWMESIGGRRLSGRRLQGNKNIWAAPIVVTRDRAGRFRNEGGADAGSEAPDRKRRDV